MKININSPEVIVRKDKESNIRKINFRMKPFRPDGAFDNALDLSVAYIKEAASLFAITQQITDLKKKLKVNLQENKLEIRFLKEDSSSNLSKLSFIQTYFGIPLWNSNLQLRIQSNDLTVISSVSFLTYDQINIETPEKSKLSNYANINSQKLAELLNFGKTENFKVQSSKSLYLYKYTKENRLGEPLKDTDLKPLKQISKELKPVDLPENKYYLVREVLFSYIVDGINLLNWRCLVELKTGAILHIFPFTSSITGLVFEYDPITLGENVDINDPDSVLNTVRTSVTLQRLQNPVGGVQKLRGDDDPQTPLQGYAKIINLTDDPNDPLHSPPPEAPPNKPSSTLI